MSFLKKPLVIVSAVAIVFCMVTSWLVWLGMVGTEVRFDWPDETANYFWTQRFASGQSLVVAEPLNMLVDNQIHPRSMNVRSDGSIVPGSFLGLIFLFGGIARVIGMVAVPYITPLLATIALFCWYGIADMFFNRRVAVISTVLVALHPAVIYYSATSLLPNIAVVSCVIIAIWALIKIRSTVGILLAGLLATLAIIIRPAEIVWIVGLLLITLLWQRRSSIGHSLVGVFGIIILGISLMLYAQQSIYGDWLATGYDSLTTSITTTCRLCQVAGAVLLPFGFHLSIALSHAFQYGFMAIWWFGVVGLIGAIVFVLRIRRYDRPTIGYAIVTVVVSCFLIIYYGSWEFSDPLTTQLNVLGLSYVRYWLPIYILTTPFVALGVVVIVQFFKERYAPLVTILILIALAYPSLRSVLWQRDDSLLPVRQRMRGYVSLSHDVNTLTPANAIIITERKDKVFFPDRRVIHTFSKISADATLQSQSKKLAAVAPVYYYALSAETLTNSPIQLQLIQEFGRGERLYRITTP